MLIWRWRWRCGSVKENPCARMRIPCWVLIPKVVFSSTKLIFSLEKCRFRATKGVLRYVFRRDLVILATNDNFELEICVKAGGGRTARCMGDVPVAEMLASEARHTLHAGGRGGAPVAWQTTLPTAFSRAIDRESHAGLGNSLKQ